ncbi:unnamed protein product, partial [Polarella glacialis]
ARIEEAGGQVRFDGCWNHRVYVTGKRYPGLNMSRSLGDLAGFNNAGISATPTIQRWALVNPDSKDPLVQTHDAALGAPLQEVCSSASSSSL